MSQKSTASQLADRLIDQANIMDMGRPPLKSNLNRKAATELQRLATENENLRKCAIKYLDWLRINDPIAALDSDLMDPEMLI